MQTDRKTNLKQKNRKINRQIYIQRTVRGNCVIKKEERKKLITFNIVTYF